MRRCCKVMVFYQATHPTTPITITTPRPPTHTTAANLLAVCSLPCCPCHLSSRLHTPLHDAPNQPHPTRPTHRCHLAAAACHQVFIKCVPHLLADVVQAQATPVPAGAQALSSMALTQHCTWGGHTGAHSRVHGGGARSRVQGRNSRVQGGTEGAAAGCARAAGTC